MPLYLSIKFPWCILIAGWGNCSITMMLTYIIREPVTVFLLIIIDRTNRHIKNMPVVFALKMYMKIYVLLISGILSFCLLFKKTLGLFIGTRWKHIITLHCVVCLFSDWTQLMSAFSHERLWKIQKFKQHNWHGMQCLETVSSNITLQLTLSKMLSISHPIYLVNQRL